MSFGGYLEVIWESFGGHLGPFGDHLANQNGTKMEPKWDAKASKRVPGTGPAPGTQKVPQVCNCRQKQAGGQTTRHQATPDFGTP